MSLRCLIIVYGTGGTIVSKISQNIDEHGLKPKKMIWISCQTEEYSTLEDIELYFKENSLFDSRTIRNYGSSQKTAIGQKCTVPGCFYKCRFKDFFYQ